MDSASDLLNVINEIQTLQKQQVMALMSCVHVGNIHTELKQDDVREMFSSFGVIESIHMACDPISQRHGGFAFIEYDIPEAAELAMEQMNGASLGGKKIEVRSLRIANGHLQNNVWKDMPKTKLIIEEIIRSAESYNRIYVASLNPLLAEKDIKFLFEKFGRIKSCELPCDSNRRIGYAFIEFETKEATEEALSMNLIPYAGRHLRVGKAITPPNSSPALSILPNDVAAKDDIDIAKQTKSAIRAFNEYVNFFA